MRVHADAFVETEEDRRISRGEWDPPQSWPPPGAESGIMNRVSGATVQRGETRRRKALR